MDARHESQEQQTINQLIDIINEYIRDNIDEVVSKAIILDDMKLIAKNLYHFAHRNVESDDILSKKNLLSIDRISLPIVDEMISSENNFKDVAHHIESIIAKRNHDHEFYKRIDSVLAECRYSPRMKL